MDYSTIEATDVVLTGIFPEGVVLSDVAERSSRLAFSRTDAERVTHVLITLRRALQQLEEVEQLDVKLLESNPVAGLVFERILANLSEMAFEINAHVGDAAGGAKAMDFADSCQVATRTGLIDHELAARLAPEDGDYHILLQLCLDSDPGSAPAVIDAALSAFLEYEKCAARWVAECDNVG